MYFLKRILVLSIKILCALPAFYLIRTYLPYFSADSYQVASFIDMSQSAADTQLYHCFNIPSGNYKDNYDLQAIRMTLIHNIIIRGINSIISYAPEVNEAQVKPFITYCLEGLTRFVHHHHQHEEKLYFVMLEEKMGEGSMGSNIQGHKAFIVPFHQFEDLCKSILARQVPYDAVKIIESVQAFAPVLIEHLAEEIESLKTDVMHKHFTDADLAVVEKKMDQLVQGDTSLVWDAPFYFINGDSVNGAWFPPMPAPVVFVAMNVLYRLHSDAWRYGCADRNMRIKSRFSHLEPKA
ncbi:hypothetical protein FRC03_000133 [Tulasnella sp. 419]|nr:hypothetical protein FRC03_000133 [Tulasnella sp. 419]